MSEKKLWNLGFVAGILSNFALIINYMLLMIIITEYATSLINNPVLDTSLNNSSAMSLVANVGLAASLFTLGGFLARLIGGVLISRIGAKKLLIISICVEIIASIGYFGAVNMEILCALRLLHGISYGFCSLGISTMITSNLPAKKRGEGVGYFTLSSTLGIAVGPYISLRLMSMGSYEMIFGTCVVFILICAVCCVVLIKQSLTFQNITHHNEMIQKPIKKAPGKRSNFLELRVIPIGLLCAVIYFCYSGILSYLTPYTQGTVLEHAASYFFIVYAIAMFVTRPFTGKLFDKKGERIVMIPAFIAFGVGMLLLGASSTMGSSATLLIAAFLLGYGIGVVQSTGLTVAISLVEPDRIGIANSSFFLTLEFALGIGPYVLGFIIPHAGYQNMYLLLAGLSFIGLVVYVIVRKK